MAATHTTNNHSEICLETINLTTTVLLNYRPTFLQHGMETEMFANLEDLALSACLGALDLVAPTNNESHYTQA